MSDSRQRPKAVCRGGALLLATCFFLIIVASASAQYVDTSLCIQCHEQKRSKDDFCVTIPAQTWASDDKHQRAFSYLHDTPEKQALVRNILGFDLREAFIDNEYGQLKEDGGDRDVNRQVAAVKACLRCHGTWPLEADKQFPRGPPVPLSLGVSCQACHGPGDGWDSQRRGWVLAHALPVWRCVTPAAKASLGLIDLRTASAKARLCASCHVGNLAEEKFVKHEWYAAGHPPLPSFELATFESQMPLHWKPLREKGSFQYRDEGIRPGESIAALREVPPDAIKKGYREANFAEAAANGLDPLSDLPRSSAAIVAGAAVLDAYVRLIADYSAQAAENKLPWPELALYDCGACHHELKSTLGLSARPKRRHVVGRPPLAEWPVGLAQLAAHQAAGYGSGATDRWKVIAEPLSQLERATTIVPFGDAAAMRDAAGPLNENLQRLIADSAATRYDRAAARHAIVAITEPLFIEANDFFAARQAAWAIRALAQDAELAGASDLFARRGEDVLALELPSGPNRSVMRNLGRWLGAAAGYDPAWFREQLKAVRGQTETP